ncbi:MAG TPA: hypothetical protein PK400_06775, partial [Phycisphaerales bacterium]|nr:hypothetical protein [Phycisphaerales bacterium]
MKLLDIVVKDAIIPKLKATERDEAISEIVEALVAAGALSPGLRDEFIIVEKGTPVTADTKGVDGKVYFGNLV